MPQMMLQTGRSGWYARVLEDGIVERLSSIIVAERPNAAWPVSRLVRLIAHHSSTLEDMVELSELPGLAAHWRRTATAAVEQAALRHLRLAATTGSASTPSTR
jgi:MOSC domain-containing protein YiiM